jgi:hypothetical protein
MSKKAAKVDIAAVEYALADLDPSDGETSDAAKARYLEQLETFEPKPTCAVDSGNGIQGLWRLQERIALGKPVNGKFSAEDQAKIDDVEARVAAVMLRLGSKAGTQNIDRILRLPGSTNLPNAKKRKEGRTACLTKLLWFGNASYPLDAFSKEETAEKQETSESGGGAEEFQELLEYGTIKGGEPKDRSAMFHRVVWHLAAKGKPPAEIIALLRQYPKGIAAKYLKPKDRLDAEVKRSLKKSPPPTHQSSPSGTRNTRTCLRAGRARCCRSSRPPRATPISSCWRRPRFTSGMPNTSSRSATR